MMKTKKFQTHYISKQFFSKNSSTSKKISIVPQIKKFKQMIKKKKQEIKNRPVSKNLPQKLSKNSPQKPQKRKNELPLPYQPKKKKIDSAIDSTILRKQTDELQIGSEAQRKTLPLITADSNNFKFFSFLVDKVM